MKTILLVLFCSVLVKAENLNCFVTTETNTTVTAAAATEVLPKKNRKCLYVQNKGLLPVYLYFKSTTAGNTAIVLGTSTIWIPSVVPTNPVYMRASSGTQSVTAVEGE